eukprot:CAMPEP_0197519202 /NCGR_PEP_ID=MMETSP1318-20131121/4462_1 /TAXON_ID=552666 /ORGANISM="Partenskyella glossopodia, Strain RCC365" /LENGTH=191 /DNA_ID=CAMNT_0043070045 /DNA_START=99 /DNA_END=674 /DNA_ORIENTATION=+
MTESAAEEHASLLSTSGYLNATIRGEESANGPLPGAGDETELPKFNLHTKSSGHPEMDCGLMLKAGQIWVDGHTATSSQVPTKACADAGVPAKLIQFFGISNLHVELCKALPEIPGCSKQDLPLQHIDRIAQIGGKVSGHKITMYIILNVSGQHYKVILKGHELGAVFVVEHGSIKRTSKGDVKHTMGKDN